MIKHNEAEYWLRGPLPNITSLLQPVAHALLQAQSEIEDMMKDFTDDDLWKMPAGVASPAFHLQHICGVLDRLFTYAKGNELTELQLVYLSKEGKIDATVTVQTLLEALQKQMKLSLLFLQTIKPKTLAEVRYVGRKKVPSTQLGLLFHAAEHTMRHTGQLMVTVKIIKAGNEVPN